MQWVCTQVNTSEDVGLADPQAMIMATSAMYALEHMGVPEGLIPLSNAIIYVCEAEKSNSVITAMTMAREDAVKNKDDVVPSHLKNKEDKSIGAYNDGKSYKYPHDYGGYCHQQYLPDSLKDRVYYFPKDAGYEGKIIERRKNRKYKD